MTQPKQEIEDHYNKPDPWGYQTNPDDLKRKDLIIKNVKLWSPYERAFDIGAGEGWITKDLPAAEKYGFELSDKARERFPSNVFKCLEPKGEYDLVIATGVMYQHYDWERFVKMINDHANGIVLTCNIEAWEIPDLKNKINGKQVLEARFRYREFFQKLRVFKVIK